MNKKSDYLLNFSNIYDKITWYTYESVILSRFFVSLKSGDVVVKIIGVIPARFHSSRLPGKPIADICGKPMIWWVYQNAIRVKEFDAVYVATDNGQIRSVCDEYNMNVIMTSTAHDTPTSRIYEVSQTVDSDLYVFIGGDEPLVDSDAISEVVGTAVRTGGMVTNAMTVIASASQVIDYSNIKVVVTTDGRLLYASRSAIPYPKGELDFNYRKFVGIGAFTKEALAIYNRTKKSRLELIENCDLIRFLDIGVPVRMVEVTCRSLSVDTSKDLAMVSSIIHNARFGNG